MAVVRTNFVVRVAIVGSLDGEEDVNIIYVLTDVASPTNTICSRIATQVALWAINELLPLLHENYRLLYVEAKGLDAAISGYGREDITGPNQGGIVVSAQLPNVCTLAVAFTSGFTGRSSRGRNYVPCLTFGQTINVNFVSAITAGDFLDAYGELNAYLSEAGSTYQHVILSTRSNNADRPSGLWFLVESYGVTDLTIDAQRRRLPGRGV